MLEQLKRTFNARNGEIEEAIALLAFGKLMKAEYADLGVQQPDWLRLRTSELRREIETRVKDAKHKRLLELEAQRMATEDMATRRKRYDAEIKALKADLGEDAVSA